MGHVSSLHFSRCVQSHASNLQVNLQVNLPANLQVNLQVYFIEIVD